MYYFFRPPNTVSIIINCRKWFLQCFFKNFYYTFFHIWAETVTFYISYICIYIYIYPLWYNDEVITHLPIHGEDAAMSIINKNVELTFVQGWRKNIQKSEKLYLFICTTQSYIYRGPLPYFEYSWIWNEEITSPAISANQFFPPYTFSKNSIFHTLFV